jgi:hypothetical protein
VLFGSSKLVDCLFDFESTDKMLINDKTKIKFINLITSMRTNVFKEKVINKNKLLKILFDE